MPQLVGNPLKEVVDARRNSCDSLEFIGGRPRAAGKADFLLAQFGLDQIAREAAARAPQIDLKGQRILARLAGKHPLQRRVRNKTAIPIMFALDFGGRKTRRQGTARHDMFHADIMRGVVEIDEIAGSHIHRADAETGNAGIDEVEIHQAFEGRFQRGNIVIAQGINVSRYERHRRRDPRLEEARRAPEQIAQCAKLIEPCMNPFLLDLQRRMWVKTGAGAALTVSQKSRRRSTRFSGGLPATSAELMAPIEMPATQSGCRLASAKA